MIRRLTLLALLLGIGLSVEGKAQCNFLLLGAGTCGSAAGGAFALVSNRADALGEDGGTSGAFNSIGANLIVVALSHDDLSIITDADITDNQGNTDWVLDGTYESSSASVSIFSHPTPNVGASHTITVACSNCFSAIAIATFSGANAAPFDGEDGAGADSVTTISPATGITPSVDDALIISALSIGAATPTVTNPAGFTETGEVQSGSEYGIVMAYKIQGSATAEDPTWTTSVEAALATMVAAFKPQ